MQEFDISRGIYRGPIMKIQPQKLENLYRKNLLPTFLRDARISVPVESWQLAVVLDIKDLHAEILILTKKIEKVYLLY